MHSDPELLALLALGEDAGTPQEREHVATCAVCAAELAELQQVVALARSAADLALVEPASRVWEAIRAEIARPGLLARGTLAPVGAGWSGASADAEVVTDEQGRRVLQVTLHAALPTDGVRQAWLVHRDDPQVRQTVGILDGEHGLWTVAHEIDLADFGVLDISQQGVGSTEHSGDTIVRGSLVLVG